MSINTLKLFQVDAAYDRAPLAESWLVFADTESQAKHFIIENYSDDEIEWDDVLWDIEEVEIVDGIFRTEDLRK